MTLTIDTLRALLAYDPATGALTWRLRDRRWFRSDRECSRWNSRYANREAFRIGDKGYRGGMVLREMHAAHRVAWAIYHGAWPCGQIDHINQDRTDNRISNLRDVTRSENCRNTSLRSTNSSGVIGVSPHKGRWRAYIRVNGENRHLGVYATLQEAAAARAEASRAAGYHENHGANSSVRWSDPTIQQEHAA